MFETGEMFYRPKKEQAVLNCEFYRLKRSFGGVSGMRGMPDILLVIDQQHEKIAVREARKMGITIFGVLDTNSDPEGIDVVIPANDDSIRSIQLLVSIIADAIIEGTNSDPDMSRIPRYPYPDLGGGELSLVESINSN